MKDILIRVSKETRMVDLTKSMIGVDNENLQQNLVFEFSDEFVDGTARLEYVLNGEKRFVMLEKAGNRYNIPIKNILLKKGQMNMQLVITESERAEGIPVFKSNMFYVKVNESINAETEAPDEYQQWIEIANAKLSELDEAIDDCKENGDYAKEQGNFAKAQGEMANEVTGEMIEKAEGGYFDGKSLEFIWQGTKLGIRLEGESEYKFVNLQGIQGPKGETGEPFKIKKTYSSVSEMNEDFGRMEFGDYVMIASSVEEEDNAKLFTRGEYEWIFITDFSGAMGIRGPVGKTPRLTIGNIATIEPTEQASATITGTDEEPILNMSIPKGRVGDVGPIGPTGETGNGIINVEKVSSEGLVDKYQINFTNGTHSEFEVTNGKDGEEAEQEDIDRLNAEVDDLYNALPTDIATGTESLSYDNAKEVRIIDSVFKGNEKQETTTGKNLLNINTTYEAGYSTTINGITYTINKDGSITAKGTATNLSIFNVFNTQSALTNLVGKEIILSGCPKGMPSGTFLAIYDSSYSDTNKIVDIGTGTTGTITTDLWRFIVRIPNGVTIDTKFYPMIRLSNVTDDSYEPYTGGQPSPNPEFPSEVETLKSWNLFDVSKVSLNSYGLDLLSIQGQYLKGFGTNTKTNNSFITDYDITDIVKKYGSVYISYKLINGIFNEVIRINTKDSSGSVIARTALKQEETKFDYVEGNTYFLIMLSNNSTLNTMDFTMGIQISAVQKPYLPYGSIGKKYTGANRLNPNSLNINKMVSRINGELSSSTASNASDFIKVENYNNIILSYNYDMLLNEAQRAYFFYDKNKNSLDGNYYQPINKINSIRIPQNAYYIRITLDKNCYDIQVSKENIPYEPYQEEIQYIDLQSNEVLSLDELHTDRKGKTWLVKKWGKVVLDGSEDWKSASSVVSGTSRFYYDNNNVLNPAETNKPLSNMFKSLSWAEIYSQDTTTRNGVSAWDDASHQGRLIIRIDNTYASDVATFKTWLEENKPVVYYKLAEPQIIELPDVEPIKSLEGTNNVEILATLEPTAMQEEYVVDLEKKLNGNVVEIGSYQTSYQGKVLPAIPVERLREAYEKDRLAIPQVLHWTLYGTENNLKIVSSDHIADEYSIDVVIHNEFHCEYKWTDSTTGNVIPNVKEG